MSTVQIDALVIGNVLSYGVAGGYPRNHLEAQPGPKACVSRRKKPISLLAKTYFLIKRHILIRFIHNTIWPCVLFLFPEHNKDRGLFQNSSDPHKSNCGTISTIKPDMNCSYILDIKRCRPENTVKLESIGCLDHS